MISTFSIWFDFHIFSLPRPPAPCPVSIYIRGDDVLSMVGPNSYGLRDDDWARYTAYRVHIHKTEEVERGDFVRVCVCLFNDDLTRRAAISLPDEVERCVFRMFTDVTRNFQKPD